MPTLHNSAQKGDFAPTVLMPGDPLRAKFIVDNYLTNAVLVNNVRGIQGYTGEYKGKRVSVMASGMGMPSIGIYSWELYESYGVENIIRVGSAGAVQDRVNVMDIVLVVENLFCHQVNVFRISYAVGIGVVWCRSVVGKGGKYRTWLKFPAATALAWEIV